MHTHCPNPEQVGFWKAEADRRYPTLVMVLQFRQSDYGWEYSLYFQEKDPKRKVCLPPLMRTEALWFPLEMFWREDGRSELEFLFGLFADEENLNESIAIQTGESRPLLHAALEIALYLGQGAATGLTAFLGSICVAWILFWGLPLSDWVPLLLMSGIFQLALMFPAFRCPKLQASLWASGGIGGAIGTVLSILCVHFNEIGNVVILLAGASATGISLYICKAILSKLEQQKNSVSRKSTMNLSE